MYAIILIYSSNVSTAFMATDVNNEWIRGYCSKTLVCQVKDTSDLIKKTCYKISDTQQLINISVYIQIPIYMQSVIKFGAILYSNNMQQASLLKNSTEEYYTEIT
jgi:hypothetical protein